jgi:DNA-binding SARP family transcriptional activator
MGRLLRWFFLAGLVNEGYVGGMASVAYQMRIRSFGSPAVEGPTGPLGGCAAQRQALALLTLLAVGDRGVSRDRIYALLWPETDGRRAGHRLSQLLYALRGSLGQDAFLTGSGEIRLNRERISSDVAEFQEACSREDFERAVACYGGPLLDGFFLSDAPEFERWAEAERVALARAFTEALETLAITAESRGEGAEAATWWTRLAEHEPLSSRVIIRLMSALAAHGDRAGALEQARRYEEELGRELEADPNPAVVALADRLRRAPAATVLSPTSRRSISIAVLPFARLGVMPENYLAEGLVEEITHLLAQLQGVRVISVTSVDRLSAAGPSAVLEGIIHQIDDRLRLIVRLVDSADRSYLWSSRYDRVVDDVFALQDELSMRIVEELRGFLGSS